MSEANYLKTATQKECFEAGIQAGIPIGRKIVVEWLKKNMRNHVGNANTKIGRTTQSLGDRMIYYCYTIEQATSGYYLVLWRCASDYMQRLNAWYHVEGIE